MLDHTDADKLQEESDSVSAAVKTRETLEQVTILFSGDSGDGVQLTGGQLTATSAVLGNTEK